MTILLTGATGFLGSHLLKSMVESGHKVIALKRSTSDIYRVEEYLERASFYNIDQIDISELFTNNKIDIVINTATDYGRKDTKLSSVVNTNVIFGLQLLEVSINNGVKVFINTDTLLERNINAYALSKAQLVDWMQFLSNDTTKMVNIKIEHMYGVLDDDNKFIYWLINQLKQKVQSVNLTSGIQKRDFIYIDDIVTAYEVIIDHIDTLSNYEEFELGCGKAVELKTFIETLYKELSKNQKIETELNFGAIKYRDGENMCMQADISKLKILGWKPKISMEDGIKRIINGEKYND